MDALENITLVAITEEAINLAQLLLDQRALPKKQWKPRYILQLPSLAEWIIYWLRIVNTLPMPQCAGLLTVFVWRKVISPLLFVYLKNYWRIGMVDDSIINELHQFREEHARKFNYDLKAIFQDLKEQERQSAKSFFSLPDARNQPVPEK